MTRFLGRPLERLDAIYDIEGSQVRTDRIDLGGISLVHDVSRGGEVAAIRRTTRDVIQSGGGNGVTRLWVTDNITTGGGSTDFQLTFDPYANILAAGLDPRQLDVWVTSWAVGADLGAISTSQENILGVVRNHLGMGAGNQNPITTLSRIERFGNSTLAGGMEAGVQTDQVSNFPQLLQFTSSARRDIVAWLATSTGADTFFCAVEFLIAPSGLIPDYL